MKLPPRGVRRVVLWPLPVLAGVFYVATVPLLVIAALIVSYRLPGKTESRSVAGAGHLLPVRRSCRLGGPLASASFRTSPTDSACHTPLTGQTARVVVEHDHRLRRARSKNGQRSSVVVRIDGFVEAQDPHHVVDSEAAAEKMLVVVSAALFEVVVHLRQCGSPVVSCSMTIGDVVSMDR